MLSNYIGERPRCIPIPFGMLGDGKLVKMGLGDGGVVGGGEGGDEGGDDGKISFN